MTHILTDISVTPDFTGILCRFSPQGTPTEGNRRFDEQLGGLPCVKKSA